MRFEDYLAEIVIQLGNRGGKGVAMVRHAFDEYNTNPLNDDELIIDGALVELKAYGDKVEIRSIRTLKAGEGGASKALKIVTAMADKFDVELELFPKAYGTGGLSTSQLKQWYSRNGFKPAQHGQMSRKPKGQ